MILYNIALSMAINSPNTTAHLIDIFSNAESVFNATNEELSNRAELNDKYILKLSNKKDILANAQCEIDFCERYKIRTLIRGAEDYPSNLSDCHNAPHVLYAKGDIDFNASLDKWISIVGTRKNTAIGNYYCETIVREIAETHPEAVIVSGLAYGIDSIAHRTALKYGLKTVAFVAHGLDMIYPSQHRSLAQEIISNGGAIVTEYTKGVQPLPSSFLVRNRLVAGVSAATVIVESPLKGGAMSTASIADSYGRDVFAMVGRSTDKSFLGCNNLIKTNRANMLENIKDLEYVMGWKRSKDTQKKRNFNLSLTDKEQVIYNCFKDGQEISIDEIIETTSMSAADCFPLLTSLELNDIIKQVKGMLYIKLR